MKKTYLSLATALTLAAIFLNAPIHAQSTALIHHEITSQKLNPPTMGRDFWFAEQSNDWGVNEGGKYMRIYITSAKNCIAYVVSQGVTTPLKITAFKVTTFLIPEFWEMESSGIPEQKAIHVYSKDADLSVYNLSHNAYSSDGEYVIPTIGWGTDYVVAAYESLTDLGTGGGDFDLPSTMAVVADQDNTTVQITPSCDCRVGFPAGVMQTFTLNRGDAIQLMPVMAPAEVETGYDMTGTIIHSSMPVGVFGGAMEANIPYNFPYSDHVEDMMPPVRTWGETYYTNSFACPPNLPTHDLAQYLFISSMANQTILRHSCDSGTHTECVIPYQYGIYWDELALGQKFWSDQPFLVVEYHNSSSYPDNSVGSGDPAEVHINPREQFTDTILFQTPQSIGNIKPYFNYANVICNVKDAGNVLFDNKKLSGLPSQCIDGNWEIFTVTDIAPGTHTVYSSGDSGVGVDAYGDGFDETYAWSSPAGVSTFQSPDTVPPHATIGTQCYQSYVHVTDSGLLPGGQSQSGLSEIRLDSVYNMTFLLDQDWLDGTGRDSVGYGMFIVDPNEPAILIVSAFDMAGNRTTITSTYIPQVAVIEPPERNLGVYIPGSGNPPNIAYDTLINEGTTAFDIDSLYLKYGNVGFSLHNSAGGPVDKSPLAPGTRRIIQIQFKAIQATRAVDSIIFGNTCDLQAVAVIGGGGAPDFFVTSQTWPNVLLTQPPTCYQGSVRIENLSKSAVTIDSASWSDAHFKADTIFPITVPPSPANVSFPISYCPDNGTLTVPNRTQGNWYSHNVLEQDGKTPSVRNDSLVGWAVAPSETFGSDTVIVTNCEQQGDTIPITFTLAATGTAPTIVKHVYQSDPTDFFGLTGMLSNGNTWIPDTGAQNLQPGQSVTITTYYIVPFGKDTSKVDVLTVVDGNGDTIATTDGKALTATVITNYYAGQVIPPTLTFGPTLFQDPQKITKTFVIQNTAQSGLIIDNVTLQAGGKYNPAYTITTVQPIVPGVPDTLPPGQLMTVTVTFNDSTNGDPVQPAVLQIASSNSCNIMQDSLVGILAGSGVTEANTPPLGASILRLDDGRALEIILPADMPSPANFELVNVLGQSVLRAMFVAGSAPTVDASGLPRGVYFWRLSAGHESQSGKVIIGQ